MKGNLESQAKNKANTLNEDKNKPNLQNHLSFPEPFLLKHADVKEIQKYLEALKFMNQKVLYIGENEHLGWELIKIALLFLPNIYLKNSEFYRFDDGNFENGVKLNLSIRTELENKKMKTSPNERTIVISGNKFHLEQNKETIVSTSQIEIFEVDHKTGLLKEFLNIVEFFQYVIAFIKECSQLSSCTRR